MSRKNRNATAVNEGYPPVHSKGQPFISPMVSPVEEPFIGVQVDDLLVEEAPNPLGLGGIEGRGKRK